jgi:uncharacterized membrane protein
LPDSIYGRINYLLNKLLYLCRLSFSRALFVANFIHRDEGIAARFPFGAARAFRFRHTAEA